MSMINTLTVNGKTYEIADAAARGEIARDRQIAQILRNNGAAWVRVDREAVKEHTYSYINELNNGAVETTASAIGVSDHRICKAGDRLVYKLSCDKNNPIIATYDKDLNLVATVMAEGRSNYLEGEYVFSGEEAYFRVSGITTDTYFKNYQVAYKGQNTGYLVSEGDLWEGN